MKVKNKAPRFQFLHDDEWLAMLALSLRKEADRVKGKKNHIRMSKEFTYSLSNKLGAVALRVKKCRERTVQVGGKNTRHSEKVETRPVQQKNH